MDAWLEKMTACQEITEAAAQHQEVPKKKPQWKLSEHWRIGC
jgi:hypothetical protein